MLAEQIRQLRGQGLEAGVIARQLGVQEDVVNFELNRAGLIDEDIPDEEFSIIRTGLIKLAKYAEDEHLKARVGMFLWEQKRGSAKMRQAPPVNVYQLNQMIAASTERANQMIANLSFGPSGASASASPAQPSPALEDNGSRTGQNPST